MLRPLFWLFRAKSFYNIFFKMLFIAFGIFILGGLIFFLFPSLLHTDNLDISASVVIFLIILIGILFTILQGYFWNVTEAVIARKVDISLNNIYSKRLKKFDIIQVPVFKPLKFLWRGIASFIANILMVSPYIALAWFAISSENYTLPSQYPELYKGAYVIAFKMIFVLFFLFLPGFLWNYAKENSVVAGLNIVKSVYLLESYPLKYFTNLAFLFIAYYVNYFIFYNSIRLIFISHAGIINFGEFILFAMIYSFVYLYWLHVCAYLLGTITPPEEY